MFIDHAEMVAKLAKPGEEILASLDGGKAHMLHMIMGMAGEVGELLDAIKKHVAYDKPLDLENVIEEMGDIEFYFEGLRQGLGIERMKVIDQNIEKLSKRYHKGSFSNDQANDRADKTHKYTVDQLLRFSASAVNPGQYELDLLVEDKNVSKTVQLDLRYGHVTSDPAFSALLIQTLNGETQ